MEQKNTKGNNVDKEKLKELWQNAEKNREDK